MEKMLPEIDDPSAIAPVVPLEQARVLSPQKVGALRLVGQTPQLVV